MKPQCESVQRSADFSDELKPLNWARADMHHYSILSSLPWMPLISICPSPLCLCSFMPFFKVDCKALGTKISGVSVNGKDRLTPSSCPELTVGNGWRLQCWEQGWADLVNGWMSTEIHPWQHPALPEHQIWIAWWLGEYLPGAPVQNSGASLATTVTCYWPEALAKRHQKSIAKYKWIIETSHVCSLRFCIVFTPRGCS